MDAQGLTSSQRKLVMWYKVKELKSKGLHCAQIAHELGLHRPHIQSVRHINKAFINGKLLQYR